MNDDFLIHHGIKGQKWGVRRFQYENGAWTPEGRERYGKGGKSFDNRGQANKNSKRSDSPRSNKQRKYFKSNQTIGELSEEEIQLGVQAAAAVSAVALTVLYARIKHNSMLKADISKNVLNNNTDITKKIKGAHSVKDDMKAVNSKGYATGDPKYRMNCTMCTAAYDMRRRGYDVEANTTTMGRNEKAVLSWYNMTKKDLVKSRKYNDIKEKLMQQPDGARGNIMTGVGDYDSKHSMVWEKSNGKITIRDCQDNKVYDDIDNSIIRKDSRNGYQFIRTDNAEINFDKIKDAVRGV